MDSKKMNNKNKVFDPNKTRELQKDWQGWGKASVYHGLVVLFFLIFGLLSK